MVSVNVEGYLDTSTGQGEAARLYARALEAAGVTVARTTLQVEEVDTGPPAERLAAAEQPPPQASVEADVNLLCVNGLELPLFAASRGRSYFTRRPTAGVWAWETDLVPERMLDSDDLLDEIWVYSRYVQENLAAVLRTPVHAVPLPVLPPGPAAPAALEGLPEGFKFVFSFSFLSTIERKNPLGLIEAFCRAFDPGEGPALVLKSVNGSRLPQDLERVRSAAAARPDVVLIDRLMGPEEHGALFEACDCYVSLHRSEGFGLTLAEAMIRAKPVIATGFSGNMDFMTPENSYPVGFELVRIGEGGAVYPAEGHWAAPDLDQAAAAMRRVWQRPDEARGVGERARADLSKGFSPQAVGEHARSRLERLAASPRRSR